MPYRKLFLSRWAALLWACGILWTAIDTIGFGPPANLTNANLSNASLSNSAAANTAADPDDTDATGVEVNSADLAILANVMKGN